MARERSKLSEKQERILVQCQLMGLTPRDMQQISNRLIALQKEAEYKESVSSAVSGMAWKSFDKGGWKITDSDGKIFECTKFIRKKKSYWDSSTHEWNIRITKPGTRYQEKFIKGVNAPVEYYITAKLCPDNSKDLYGLLKFIKSGKIS